MRTIYSSIYIRIKCFGLGGATFCLLESKPFWQYGTSFLHDLLVACFSILPPDNFEMEWPGTLGIGLTIV